ncbi:LLM class flavin-dependent oxidoreductase [Nocardioides sp. NPDC051685]|uniref:LLM class flavin-dependent oxidoreductase n=1 Tax=Nocardioides sp. NPDC051685 TaxID=3364334 RepID=UPI003797F207
MTSNHINVCVMPHAGGWHKASWRRPDTTGNDIWNPDLWRGIAQTAERGKLDAVFMADNQSVWPMSNELRHLTAKVGVWDALIAVTMMASVTEHIGLIATAHTQFHQPYILARQLACIDHLSGGRTGWNVVTSGSPFDAANFSGAGQVSTELRYDRATEFVALVKKLWDSWEDDAYLIDKEAGVFYDASKMHPTEHHGTHFDVAGPLNIMRPPQGYPVIAQAGSSGPGREFAASVGEVIFTPLTGDAGRAYTEGLREVAASKGRGRADMKVLSQITPVIGRTDQEAQDKWEWLASHLDPRLALDDMEGMLGVDLKGYDLDEPLPELGDNRLTEGYRQAVLSLSIDGRKPTLRELIARFNVPGTVVGSPETIADYMENEVDSGVCDGFILCLQGTPEELEDFVDLVVPELQRRGRFRTEYEHSTLRETLGFKRPANQFATTLDRVPSEAI